MSDGSLPRSTKVVVELTLNQLDDVVTCLRHGYERALGYGHVTRQEGALAESTRRRLLEKLQLVQSEPWFYRPLPKPARKKKP